MNNPLIGRRVKVTNGEFAGVEGSVISVGYTSGGDASQSYFEALILDNKGYLYELVTKWLQVLPPHPKEPKQ